jgi:hypothetical protein
MYKKCYNITIVGFTKYSLVIDLENIEVIDFYRLFYNGKKT